MESEAQDTEPQPSGQDANRAFKSDNSMSEDEPLLTPSSTQSTVPPEPTWRTKTSTFIARNRGVLLVTLAQFFGSMMNATARLLEHRAKLHPLQVLFARMSITIFLSYLYMWYKRTPYFPLGDPAVRALLIFRGLFGFLGIYGIWSSLMYLDLSEATVLTFLTPSVAGYASHILLHERFTAKEQIASLIAFAGVIVIARPVSLFSSPSSPSSPDPSPDPSTNTTTTIPALTLLASAAEDPPTPLHRLLAIGMGMLGVIGASGAYTLIRWIGHRAHPLISVSYFSGTSTVVSALVLSLAPLLHVNQPALSFALPRGWVEWGMLLFTGACGFVMQFLLTAGLRMDRTNRATMAMYTQMVFAVVLDWVVFGTVMDWVAGVGCGMILGSAVWVSLMMKGREKGGKEGSGKGKGEDDDGGEAGEGERAGLLAEEEGNAESCRAYGSTEEAARRRSERLG